MIYNFRNKKTGEIIEESMPMVERESFLEKNPEYEQILIKPPQIVDPLMLGRLNKAGKDFQKHVLGRMKNAIPKNNIGRSKFAQNITEI